ncbi:MAG: hypothetical protein F9K16_11205 [Thermoanaerobaculia bacterium]|nr:MAG: hypothetical protein F9K16_11205 [Thermoanaerobaculia bacterium]MBZ0101420.1 hypothetical protein [Thermoanaerobaculia bacterium]
MLTELQRRAGDAVTAAIQEMGGKIVFRQVLGMQYVLGEASCSRGEVRVYLYEYGLSVDYRVGENNRVFELVDFESQDAMIRALCESLQIEIAQGPYPFFPPPAQDEDVAPR